SLNPLTYAIEPIRYLYLHSDWSIGSIIIETPFADISFGTALLVLLVFDIVTLVAIQPLLRRRFA
ncbi:MAG: ABC transporter permease, partial [Okeania sp. SIO3C4]|nr:ABC transporter permease [Okeania sp. SIO3C4]